MLRQYTADLMSNGVAGELRTLRATKWCRVDFRAWYSSSSEFLNGSRVKNLLNRWSPPPHISDKLFLVCSWTCVSCLVSVLVLKKGWSWREVKNLNRIRRQTQRKLTEWFCTCMESTFNLLSTYLRVRAQLYRTNDAKRCNLSNRRNRSPSTKIEPLSSAIRST